MIYKFDEKFNGGKTFELEQDSGSTATLKIRDLTNKTNISFRFDKTQIYDLIGSLHSVQTKIKNFKEVKNG